MRLTTLAPNAPGGHCGLQDGPTRHTVPLGSRLGGQRSLRPLADGSGLGKAQGTGSNARPVRLPASPVLGAVRCAPVLGLPSLADGIPATFSTVPETCEGLVADLLDALYRERVVQPRHWEPGKNLLKVATDGVEEWAHRRGRLGTRPLRALSCLELHIAADIYRIGDQQQGDWYCDPRVCGWLAFGGSVENRPVAAIALDVSGQTAYSRPLKPWAEVLESAFGKEIARSFVGLANTAVEALDGWGPGYAFERSETWDEYEESALEDGEENDESYRARFKNDLPDYATDYAFKRAHLKQLEAERGAVGILGAALVELARALPAPWRKRIPANYSSQNWGSNHAHLFGAHAYPSCAFSWSADTLPGGGYDVVSRIFDDEFEMIQNAETVPFFWLYAFDPQREGNGPGTLGFALEILNRQLRLIRAMDEVLVLLDEDPTHQLRVRARR
jgi:hypothetical protein